MADSSQGNRQLIGLLGGTFDPVHNGHLTVARLAIERCRLDRILFLPAPSPPHKERPLTPFFHRAAMLEAALAGEPRMALSTLEAERPPPSYTVDTLRELYRRLGNHHYHLIVGADMFIEITLWHRYLEIFELADLIVAARPGVDDQEVWRHIAELPGRFSHDPGRQRWCREDGFRILFLPETREAVSSSGVRQLLGRGAAVDQLLPGSVLEYIRRHHLYGGKRQGET